MSDVAVLVSTPGFEKWCREHGWWGSVNRSPAVAWLAVAIYCREREIAREKVD